MPVTVQGPDGKTYQFPDGTDKDAAVRYFKAKGIGQPSQPADPSGRTPTGELAQGDTRNSAQRYLDNLTARDPRREEWQSPTRNAIDTIARGSGEAFLSSISHPLQTLKGIGSAIADAHGDATQIIPNLARPMIENTVRDYQESGPAYAAEHLGGNIIGGGASGEVTGGLIRGAGAAGSMIRDAAIGDPNVAALRGLRVGPASPKSLSTLRAVEGSRPFLQGAQNLEDLQAKIPAAKNEIWGPYKQTVDAIGDKAVKGPDGMTTVGELEAERQQLSALNRGLKKQNPEAIQLAQQKGMTQAQLLDRERAVQSALDPQLEAAGVDPKLIRQTFGQVSQVGERVSGKSTLAEPDQPYGFGRMLNMKIDNPRSWLGEPAQGVRDLAAGRPLWSGKPTDINLREAFRTGGPKPDFSSPSLVRTNWPPLQLGAGEELGRPYPAPRTTPPAPPSLLQLPDTASAGEAEPMLRYARPYVEPPEPSTIRPMPPVKNLQLPAEASPGETKPYYAYRPAPEPGERFGVVPTRLARLQMQGEPLPSSGGIKGLLPAPDVPAPQPEPTSAHIYPAGSAYRGLPLETPVYPAGSQFRPTVQPFDIDQYLKGQSQ